MAEKSFMRTMRRLAVAGCIIGSLGINQSAFAVAAGRPIISGGTIKTADRQLLRGCHAHILRDVNSTVSRFFTIRSNVQKLKDQAHMNVIRIAFITPGWGGAASPDDGLPIADSIIANCEAVGGVYAIINYHGPTAGGAWDLNAFWDKMAQRYKDKTCVLFGAINELFYSPPADVDRSMADLYKNHMRKWAPNTMIMGIQEPVEMNSNWGPYMRDILGPFAGINWSDGKDCFSFHVYGSDKTEQSILGTRTFVPVMCTEFSFAAEGWTQLNIGGYAMPAEWCERNGVSWIVWQDRKPTDQLSAVMNYLIPDAIAKKYAWWTNTSAHSPKTTVNVHTRINARSGSVAVLVNGRIVLGQAQKTRMNQLEAWKKIVRMDR